jgi:hypothetical protein
MRTALAALLVVLAAPAAYANDRCPSSTPIDVENKLSVVLDARDLAAEKNDWWDKAYEDAFEHLMQSKDPASREARVALMDYYVGEHYGEELVCAVALDGKQMIAPLELYSRCDVKPSHIKASRTRALPLRGYALEMLRKGNAEASCTYD